MVDVFLRICSNVQPQMEDFCVSTYIQLFSIQFDHKGAGTFIKDWMNKEKTRKNKFTAWATT